MNLISKISILLILISYSNFGLAQRSNIDSLKNLLTTKADTHQIKLLNQIAKLSMEMNPSEGIKYASKAIELSQKIDYPFGINYGRNTMGICYDVLGKYDSAMYYYHEALKLPLSGNESFIGGVYSNIGLIYWNTDDYARALNSFFKAKELLKSSNNYSFKSNILNNIGLIYHDIKDYKQSSSYFEQAMQLGMENKDTISILSSVINLAINYFETNQNDKGRTILNKYYKYSYELNEYEQSEYILTKAASEIHTVITDSTERLLKKALSMKEKIGHTLGEAAIYNSLSDLYRIKKDYNTSNLMCYKALKYTDELQSIKKIQQVYDNLFANYLILNKKDSAIKYHKLYIQTTDSLFAESKVKAFSKELIAFKTFEKEKEILSLTIENNKNQARNKFIIFSSLAIMALFGLFIWGIWYRKKQHILQEQREQIHQKVAETELLERERIARDIHDGVGQKLSVVKMQLSLKDLDIKSTSNLLDEAIQDVRNVSHNLLPTNLDNGLVRALDALCLQVNAASDTLKIYLKTSPDIQNLNIDKQHTILIYRMIQELIHNAIKYSKAKNIHINMDCDNHVLKLSLSDDGIGFDLNELKINNGIGIKNISERIAQLIGTIQLTSDLGKGTQYNITIPL